VVVLQFSSISPSTENLETSTCLSDYALTKVSGAPADVDVVVEDERGGHREHPQIRLLTGTPPLLKDCKIASLHTGCMQQGH